MRTEENTVSDVIAMINRALEQPVEGLTADTPVLEITGFDSLAMERLALELSEKRGKELDPLAFGKVETVRDLAAVLAA
ncbi:MAG: acyl carrier protein [Parvibaculaceae bacterium]